MVVLGERAIDAFRRPRRACDSGGEGFRVELASVDEDAFAIGDEVGREVSAGPQAVLLRIAAVMRVVEDLPLVPNTWTASKRRSGDPRTVIIRRILSRPKRIPNSSSERS